MEKGRHQKTPRFYEGFFGDGAKGVDLPRGR